MTNSNGAVIDSAPNTTLTTDRPPNRLARLGDLFAGGGHTLPLTRVGGRVSEVTSSHVRISGLSASVTLGTLVEIDAGDCRGLGEVIAIQPSGATIKLFSAAPRIGLGSRAWVREDLIIKPSVGWIGRVVNALGEPIDGDQQLPQGSRAYSIDNAPLEPMDLDRVHRPIITGVRTIDLFTPICAGQRIGIFAGSGVGKSTLVSMLARSSGFNTLVIALVAERGREVREFIEDVIQATSARAVTVVATSSESAMMRKMAAKTAMTIGEYFRDIGDDVLLIVDSVTRYAHALREVALAAGELPVARGYTPSVFAELPRLLERAGPGTPNAGSITGIFSVLVDGDDHNDPVADAVRGVLDGHIVLDRSIAEQGRYPAINPLASISRLASIVWSKEEAALVRRLRALISRFEETRELRTLGGYKEGADPELDQAIALTPIIYRLLTQFPDDPPSRRVFDELAAALSELKQKAAEAPSHEGERAKNRDPNKPS